MVGYNLTVVCNASGIPAPMVTWIKVGGGEIITNGSELVFTNISKNEDGEYKCEASNECGSASETATIKVQCKFSLNHRYFFYNNFFQVVFVLYLL